MEVIHLSLICRPAHKSCRLTVALWGLMVLSEAPKQKPASSFSCTSPSLVSLRLYTLSSDENWSPQRIPASHWLAFHRNGWWGERTRVARRGRALKKMQLCHSLLTDHWAKGCWRCKACLRSANTKKTAGLQENFFHRAAGVSVLTHLINNIWAEGLFETWTEQLLLQFYFSNLWIIGSFQDVLSSCIEAPLWRKLVTPGCKYVLPRPALDGLPQNVSSLLRHPSKQTASAFASGMVWRPVSCWLPRIWVDMPVMKGLLAPQNTFLDTIATRFDGTREYNGNTFRQSFLTFINK